MRAPAYAKWWGCAALVVATAVVAQPARLPTVGVVWFGSAAAARPFEIAFKEGLRTLGYVQGRNIDIVTRYADGNPERLPALISEQASRRVDVMFVSSRALPVARERAGRIPVVSAGFSDPVAEGFAASLAKPGGNFTGLSWSTALTTMKRLELAREVIPALRTVGMLYDPTDPQTIIEVENARAAAATLGLELRVFAIRPPGESGLGLEAITQGKPQALLVSDFPLATQHRDQICSFAAANRIPLFAESSVFADAGAFLAFGADGVDMFRRGASYVDRILKGARAGDLPIEQPNRFFLVVNQKTAEAIEVNVPAPVLFRADRVIR
ncbi:MAG: ABC transporter substrate-binding protein [Burkholderiales bacterium]|nr:ABC transporter substrate-binding protein [Burkholderiales bacterium]